MENVYFSILEGIRRGKNLTQIASSLGKSKQALNRYVSTLKRAGCIRKAGYGCWDFIKYLDQKEVNKSIVIGRNNRGGMFTSLKPDMVRGHAFLVKIKIKSGLRNWNKREQILKRLQINFKPYFVGGVVRGQTIKFRGYNVDLTNQSIIFTFPESYIGEDASQVRRDLIYDVLRLIKGLEGKLKGDFKINSQYIFRVSRQHYALIKNALAKQYDKEKKKLEVYSHKGLWMVIDNSFNLHETETVHKDTAVEDNLKIQNFFNSLKDKPITTDKIFDMEAFQQGLAKVTQTTGENVARLTIIVNELVERERRKDL